MSLFLKAVLVALRYPVSQRPDLSIIMVSFRPIIGSMKEAEPQIGKMAASTVPLARSPVLAFLF